MTTPTLFKEYIYFYDCFGVVRAEDIEPEKIVIRAFGIECNYLRDLPLHHSQREIAKMEEYNSLVRTFDFVETTSARKYSNKFDFIEFCRDSAE